MKRTYGSYVAFDPGRKMGFAHCLAGGDRLRSGTWRFTSPVHGECFADFSKRLRALLASLPSPLVAMELMTIVAHESDKGQSLIDAKQVMFSSGWPTHTETICYSLGLPEPVFVAISTWRSATHRVLRVPTGSNLNQVERDRHFKGAALDYCESNKWKPETSDEAEALCILDYLRIENEPGYAFNKGQSGRHQMDLLHAG